MKKVTTLFLLMLFAVLMTPGAVRAEDEPKPTIVPVVETWVRSLDGLRADMAEFAESSGLGKTAGIFSKLFAKLPLEKHFDSGQPFRLLFFNGGSPGMVGIGSIKERYYEDLIASLKKEYIVVEKFNHYVVTLPNLNRDVASFTFKGGQIAISTDKELFLKFLKDIDFYMDGERFIFKEDKNRRRKVFERSRSHKLGRYMRNKLNPALRLKSDVVMVFNMSEVVAGLKKKVAALKDAAKEKKLPLPWLYEKSGMIFALMQGVSQLELGMDFGREGLDIDFYFQMDESSPFAPLFKQQKHSPMKLIEYLPAECFAGIGLSCEPKISSSFFKLVLALMVSEFAGDKKLSPDSLEWLRVTGKMLDLVTGDVAVGMMPSRNGPGLHFIKLVGCREPAEFRGLVRKYIAGADKFMPLPAKLTFEMTPEAEKIGDIMADKIVMKFDRSKFSPATQILLGMLFTQEIKVYAAYVEGVAVFAGGPESLTLIKELVGEIKKRKPSRGFVKSEKYQVATRRLRGRHNMVGCFSVTGAVRSVMMCLPFFPPDKLKKSKTGIGIGISAKGTGALGRISLPSAVFKEMKDFIKANKAVSESMEKVLGRKDQ